METGSFIVDIKTEDIQVDIAKDGETSFDISNYESDGPLPEGKSKIVIVLMKAESGGKLMVEFVTLTPKTYSYLTDDKDEDKTAKGTKKCAIKRKLKFEDYKHCLEATTLP